MMLLWFALTACGWLGGGEGANASREGSRSDAPPSDGEGGSEASADSGEPAPAPKGAERWADIDGDGYGREPWSADAYGSPVAQGGDCDEYEERVHPDAPDDWCDGIDEDCDGATDEDATDVAAWYPDVDGDGFGDASATPQLACRRRPGTVATAGDCDDADPLSNPRERETCDGADDDCDGKIDADDPDMTGVATWYADEDGDGWGGDVVATGCSGPPGAVRVPGDCDDHAPLVWQAGCAAPRARLTFTSPPGHGWLLDADGDGIADVVAAANQGWGSAPVGWTGFVHGAERGEISWGDAAWVLDTGATTKQVVDVAALGDADGDGRGRLAMAMFDVDDAHQVWLVTTGRGKASPTDGVVGRIDLGDDTPTDVWTPDLDGDGTREVVVQYVGAERHEAGVLAFDASPGERGVDEALDTTRWSALHDLFLGFADLDGDGIDDVIGRDGGDDVVIADGSAGLSSPSDAPGVRILGADVRAVAAADVDGDGHLDLQVNGSAYYLGPFSVDRDATSYDAITAEAALGDVDGDGLVDAVGSNRDGAFVVHGPLLGDLVAAGRPAFGVAEDHFVVEGVADADGDGHDDVLFSRAFTDDLELFLVSGADE